MGATLLLTVALAQATGCVIHQAQKVADIAVPPPEPRRVETLPQASLHWVFVHDENPSTIGRIWMIDGDTQRMVGMIASGFLPSFAIAADASQYLLAETYWSRGSRGTRSDFITYYDARTLQPTAETPMSDKRFLVAKSFAFQLSGDGRLLLSANMDPATSVSVIDLVKRTPLVEVSTPGCTLVLPHGAASFSSLCANGAFMTVNILPDGTVQKIRGQPFFDPDQDPVFDEWALSRKTGRAFFVSYHGQLHPVDLTGGEPQAGKSWSLTSAAERAAGWRPGGAQPIDYCASSNRLFVLMHRGEEWTQSEPGTEVWVFDVNTHLRVARLHLTTPSVAVAVTRDEAPLLFALDGKSSLATYREQGAHWQLVGDMHEIGLQSTLLTVPE